MPKSTDWLVHGALPIDLILRAWEDDSFRQRLEQDPVKMLSELGFEVKGQEIRIHSNSDTVLHFTLPIKPPALVALDSSQLRQVLIEDRKCASTGTCD